MRHSLLLQQADLEYCAATGFCTPLLFALSCLIRIALKADVQVCALQVWLVDRFHSQPCGLMLALSKGRYKSVYGRVCIALLSGLTMVF